MIPYGRQEILQQDIDAVVEVLQSPWLTQGPAVPAFEKAVTELCHVEHAIAVNSATSALHIACLALAVGPNDRVWTSPNSFVASANCARYCGATVDFVDIEEDTGNMSVAALREKLAESAKSNTLPKVVIPVHFAGQPCDMAEIKQLSIEYGFFIIEDASHAIGASYQQHPIGNCAFSDICVFSFHPVKIITSAEGGMAVTNDAMLARKMQLLRSHGITNLVEEMTEPSHGPWYYQQLTLGFNYRMTDLQAALGLSQLQRICQFVAKRNELASQYQQHLEPLAVSLLTQKPERVSSYHLLVMQLPEANSELHHRVVCDLRAAGIVAHVHYIPIHLQPYYQNLGFKMGDFPAAERYYQRSITLPLYTQLTAEELQQVVTTLGKVL